MANVVTNSERAEKTTLSVPTESSSKKVKFTLYIDDVECFCVEVRTPHPSRISVRP